MARALPVVLAILAALGLPAGAAAAGDPLRPSQWGLDLIGADAAHGTSTGGGAVVAIVDSGVHAGHPDLAGRLVAGRDVVDRDDVPQDGHGHGTHVAGIVGAATGNGVGVGSVAPGASLMPVRVLDDAGEGTTATVALGIDWAREHGAHVINLSLGSEVPLIGAAPGDEVDAAIRRALAAGIVVVAAAGNNGVPICEQPAAAEGLLCVGAVDRRRQRSYFSSFGRGLGIVAPGGSGLPMKGEDILSTVPPGLYDGREYEEMAGTSQAAPHVAGVAALLVARGLRGPAAVRRILDTATDLGAPGADAEYGHGLVNAGAAVRGAGGAPGGGGGGGGPAAGGGSPAAGAFVRVARRQPLRRVVRRGVRARMQSAAQGRAVVRLRARGRVVARRHFALKAGTPRTVWVRLSRAGRRAVRGEAPVAVRLSVRLPGESRARVLRVRLSR
jgi:subtilisin family serine protease